MGSLLFERLGNTPLKEIAICFVRKKAFQFGAMDGRLVQLALHATFVHVWISAVHSMYLF
jgi:hypothetical protein